MAESEGVVVYSQGKKYMQLPFGNTSKFILMEEYNASRSANPSSRSQTTSNSVSTCHSILSSEEDDDVVVTGSQPARAPLSNVSLRHMRRKPVHDNSNPNIKPLPSASTKRKYDETEEDAVYPSDYQQPKRMKQTLQKQRHAKAPSAQRQKYPPHLYAYQQNYSSPGLRYIQNVHQPQLPLSSAYASGKQHQNTVEVAQHGQARRNDKPSVHADGAQDLRNHPQAVPSPRIPAIPQEWLPQEPHPLLDAWHQLEGYGPQHQQDVPPTYPAQGTYHTEQAYAFHGQEYLGQQDPSRLANQSGYHEPTTVHDVHQHHVEQHQSNPLTFNPSNDSDQQSTTNPDATLRDSTTNPSELASDAIKPPRKADHLSRTSLSTAPDQNGQSSQSREGSENGLPPNTRPHLLIDLTKQSDGAQVPVMTSKAASKRKFSLDEDDLKITQAPSKRRKSKTQARTPDSEQGKLLQQVSSEAYNRESSGHNIEQSSNEYPSAEDPTSLEYALKYFDPLQLANVGDKELIEWFTADQLRCIYTPIQLRQLFSDEYLTSLGMWDIMDPLLTGGQANQTSDVALNSEQTKSRLTLPDSELDEIERSLRESNPEGGNPVDFDGNLEQSLHVEESQSSTLGQNADDCVDSGQRVWAPVNVQPGSLQDIIVSNAHGEEEMGQGSKKAKAPKGADGDLFEQQSADFDNGSSGMVGDEVANSNLQLVTDHEQAWLNVFDSSNPAQEYWSLGLEFEP